MPSGFRRLPPALLAQIEALGDDPFVFGRRTRASAIDLDALATRLELQHLEAQWRGLPPEAAGRWSRWNIGGRMVTRRDLPKTHRSWSFDTPNFGDYSRGSHTTSWTREVYQTERLYGQQLEAVVSHSSSTELPTVTAWVDKSFPNLDGDRPRALLYAASLAREWFGAVMVLPLDASGVVIETQQVTWEILPPGTPEELRTAVRVALGPRFTDAEADEAIERITLVEQLHPRHRLIGTSGFQRYIGFQFGDDFVAFENPRRGNALYLMFEDWEQLSQLSRTELLASGTTGYSRIVHRSDWFDRLSAAVFAYRHRSKS